MKPWQVRTFIITDAVIIAQTIIMGVALWHFW